MRGKRTALHFEGCALLAPRTVFVADAHRGDGKRYIMRAARSRMFTVLMGELRMANNLDCLLHPAPIRADAYRCGVKVWPLETARNLGVTSTNGFRNAGRKSTRNACPGKVIRV